MKSKKFANAAIEARRSCSTVQSLPVQIIRNSRSIAFCVMMMSLPNMITDQKRLPLKVTAQRLIVNNFAPRSARHSLKPKLGLISMGNLPTYCQMKSTKGRIISLKEITKSLRSFAVILTNILPMRLRDSFKRIMSFSFRKESPNSKHSPQHTLC